MSDRLDKLTGKWARLGAGFDAAPATRVPDLEQVLIDTARLARGRVRLFEMPLTWLIVYGDCVGRARLAAMARSRLTGVDLATMGLLLDLADERSPSPRFADVISVCRPSAHPRPLFDLYLRNASLAARAHREATEISRHWNLWSGYLEPSFDALRPPAWVMRTNPELALRSDLRGDMRASVLAALRHDAGAGASESALARAAGGSRRQVRHALDRLEVSGRVERQRSADGRRVEVRLLPAA